MPAPETIIELMEDQGIELDEAREVAELMEEHDIDDPEAVAEIYENR
jgi:type III secretion system FlhB-like substrate exporter